MIAELVMSALAVLVFLVPMLVAAWVLRSPLRVRRDTVDPYSKDGAYKNDVIHVINSARTHITMARGEIPPVVYDDDIASALRAAHGRGVNITLVCGPEVRMPEIGPHPVLRLADEGILDLYYPERTRPVHFIEADSRTLYWEGHHPHGARERDVVMFENSYFRAKGERRRLFADIDAGKVKRVKSASERHLLLTECQRRELEELCRSRGQEFDTLSVREIEALRREAEARR